MTATKDVQLVVGQVVTSGGLDRGPNWRWVVAAVRPSGCVMLDLQRADGCGWRSTHEELVPAIPRDLNVVL